MLSSLIDLLFPQICQACYESTIENQKNICINCKLSLPRTNWHLMENNPLEKVFWGRVPIQNATAFLKFEFGGKVQHLIHNLKYKGIQEIGKTLGEMAGTELLHSRIFEEVDLLLPIPIHPIKQKKRGFNQSLLIANGVSKASKIPLNKEVLAKTTNTQSQTKKSRFKRWLNVDSTFTVLDKTLLKNKHVLLIDDVITTGSTIEACAKELLKIEGLKVSLLIIAATY